MGQGQRNDRWIYFLLIGSGVLLSTLDSSMVNVALPEIMRYFSVNLSVVKYVVLVYLIVITCSLVFWGRFADKHGKGKIYLSGMLIFVIGATFCAVAATFSQLVVARSIQAFGASMMMSSGPAILKLTTPKEQLGRTLGLVGIATSLGLMIGPLVSGILLEYFDWRGVFLISLPVGGMVFLVGAKYLLRIEQDSLYESTRKFDAKGGILWVTLVGTYVVLLNGIISSFVGVAGLLIAMFILLGAFVKNERNSDDPILPICLVKKRFYWTGVSTAAISFAALFMVIILMPFYLDYIMHYSSSMVGSIMMSLPVSLVVMSPFSGWLYDHFGKEHVLTSAGLGISLLAVFFLMSLGNDSRPATICISLAILGAGQSIFLSPNSASVLKKVEDRYAGITSGILATARNFGMLTGVALAGSCFSLMFSRYTNGFTLQQYTIELQDAYMLAQQNTLAVAMLLLLIASCISFFRR